MQQTLKVGYSSWTYNRDRLQWWSYPYWHWYNTQREHKPWPVTEMWSGDKNTTWNSQEMPPLVWANYLNVTLLLLLSQRCFAVEFHLRRKRNLCDRGKILWEYFIPVTFHSGWISWASFPLEQSHPGHFTGTVYTSMVELDKTCHRANVFFPVFLLHTPETWPLLWAHLKISTAKFEHSESVDVSH